MTGDSVDWKLLTADLAALHGLPSLDLQRPRMAMNRMATLLESVCLRLSALEAAQKQEGVGGHPKFVDATHPTDSKTGICPECYSKGWEDADERRAEAAAQEPVAVATEKPQREYLHRDPNRDEWSDMQPPPAAQAECAHVWTPMAVDYDPLDKILPWKLRLSIVLRGEKILDKASWCSRCGGLKLNGVVMLPAQPKTPAHVHVFNIKSEGNEVRGPIWTCACNEGGWRTVPPAKTPVKENS